MDGFHFYINIYTKHRNILQMNVTELFWYLCQWAVSHWVIHTIHALQRFMNSRYCTAITKCNSYCLEMELLMKCSLHYSFIITLSYGLFCILMYLAWKEYYIILLACNFQEIWDICDRWTHFTRIYTTEHGIINWHWEVQRISRKNILFFKIQLSWWSICMILQIVIQKM